MPKDRNITKSKQGLEEAPVLTCIPKRLAEHLQVAAAHDACRINPQNNAPVRRLAGQIKGYVPAPLHIALLTSKYWGPEGVKLSVSFVGGASAALRTRILSHMNAWALAPKPGNDRANVQFLETQGTGDVRIAFEGGASGGYWSYLGTDIRSIDVDEPTMNLEAFTMSTPESEFHRVVRHETGHTLGFPHEHLRKSLVDKIDVAKAITYFGATQGWSPDEVRAQVLTPLEKSSIMGTLRADQRSIMCYEIPGEITKSGKPILGGLDIDAQDYAFAAKIYPPAPPAAPLPPARGDRLPGGRGYEGAIIDLFTDHTQITLLRPASGAPLTGAGRARRAFGTSVLERVIALLGNPDIIVTEDTTWEELGYTDNGALDVFVRRHVSNAFDVSLDVEDAGDTVGDLVASINRALGN